MGHFTVAKTKMLGQPCADGTGLFENCSHDSHDEEEYDDDDDDDENGDCYLYALQGRRAPHLF